SSGSLTDYLKGEGVPGIAGIDTRKLTRLLRDKGAQNGCLVAAARPGDKIDEQAAIAAARAFPGLAGMDLAKVVSTAESYTWTEGSWRLGTGFVSSSSRRFKVVVFD